MRVRTLVILALVAVPLAVPVMGASTCDTQLPEELRELRTKARCGPIPDFYERPGMVEPLFLYGYLPGNKEESAAFWCQRQDDEGRFVLVLIERGRIASTIVWQNYPGGLSHNDSADMPLSYFRYVDQQDQHGPANERTKYAPLRSEYDGVVTLFYRHGERWLFRLVD